MSARPWPENVQPTAEQFVDWFATEGRDERIRIARQLLKSTERASRCFLMNHDSLLDEVRHLRRSAARYRAAWLSARRRIHPDRFLREWRKASAAEDELIQARNLAAYRHETETPMRAHDADGECCRRAQWTAAAEHLTDSTESAEENDRG